MVPTFIMIAPAFMVPDNRVSLCVEIQRSMKKRVQKKRPRPATRLP